MTEDTEIKAMSRVLEALSELEPDAIRRVLKWAYDKYQVRGPAQSGSGSLGSTAGPWQPARTIVPEFRDFAAFFDAANPQTAADKALVAGYWFQAFKSEEDIDSFVLNKELKHLGHPSTNITRDLDSLMNRSPRLVMQVRKSGTSKQARKRYKLTTEGIKAVERMLGGASEE